LMLRRAARRCFVVAMDVSLSSTGTLSLCCV